ncbi:MAG: hypothetical protein SFU56_15610 [Capsulimonadales bacterium]|nr:hypothetical protein [Capsulimonadales bacterium]
MATPIRRQYQIFIDRPPQAVFDFFENLKSYGRILTADQEILNEAQTALWEDTLLRLRWKQGALSRILELRIEDWNEPHGFVERQEVGPFAFFVRRHKFHEFQTGTLMTDVLEYGLPPGPAGVLLDRMYLSAHLDPMMHHQQSEAKRLLETVTRIKGRGV